MLSATIDRFAYGSLDPRADRMVAIESVDFKTSAEMSLDEEILCDGSLDLIKAAVRRFGRDCTGGYDLVLRSNAPPGSGLGASPATDTTACRPCISTAAAPPRGRMPGATACPPSPSPWKAIPGTTTPTPKPSPSM